MSLKQKMDILTGKTESRGLAASQHKSSTTHSTSKIIAYPPDHAVILHYAIGVKLEELSLENREYLLTKTSVNQDGTQVEYARKSAKEILYTMSTISENFLDVYILSEEDILKYIPKIYEGPGDSIDVSIIK